HYINENGVDFDLTTGSGGNSVDTIYRTPGKDSIQFKISGRYHAIKDSIGGTYYNSNVGSAYRLAIPNTNNIKTIGSNYGIIMDSATSNQIGVKFDSATVFPQVRATIPTPTWQQTLTAGITLTGNNTIAGGAYNFTFGNMGLFTISQNAKASVSGTNGTAHVSPLIITGGAGGASSYSIGTVSGGNAGVINITGGNGGNITGTPTTGVGGTGADINLTAGDGGLGTTNGGTAGVINIAAGTGGQGTSGGSAGYVSIKGGFAGTSTNSDGGHIYLSPGAKQGSGLDGHIFLGLSPSGAVRGAATIGSATRGDSLLNIKSGGLYADRGIQFPNIPSGTKDDSLVVKGSTGTIKYINTGDFTRQQDTISLASFGGGGGQAGDTTSFSTSTIYGSFYNDGSDTLVITSIRAVLQGTSPSLVPTVYYNDSINVTAGATKLVNSPATLTNTATGASSTPDNSKIPPGVWVWVKTETVTTKPTYFSLTLLGYKKRR
ncbi:MAG: hypothetical protein IPQ08_06455, partial [Chitinophagaceae bacterium]|nr:hypothetical protein [Chitinophagaceae bacterium]